MKIALEPQRLRNILSSAMILKADPLIKEPIAEVKENGLVIKDRSLGVMQEYLIFSKNYFMEFDGSGVTNFVLTETMYDKLSWGFKGDKVTVSITEDKSKVVFEGEGENYSEPLVNKEVEEFKIEMASSDVGLLPKKMSPVLQVLIPTDSLRLPETEQYYLKASESDKRIVVSVMDIGKYTRELKFTRANILKDLDIDIDGDFYQHILNNLTGEIWFSAVPEAVAFTQKTADYSYTYLLSAKLRG